ncbi:hypothetical protein Tsubulata_007297 [Turnera subulata]|uniref:Uncharacterized protein n=1 Tax=Turnera subulata TaxID=218843 RepID=A0A9Q0FRL9_9ROSI|nr:hypothetical protein Tsubulata_007297 [Turnera subulata]
MEPRQNQQPQPPRQRQLHKQLSWSPSWSPDTGREEVWLRRKGSFTAGRRRSGCNKSVTDDDLDELKACIELGFGFGPDLDPKLSDTFPALNLYCAVNKQYNDRLSRTSSSVSSASSSSGCEAESDNGSPSSSLFDPGDDPETIKARLKQWAQVVACTVRQNSGEPR